jgi:hypothetical protein
MKKFFNLQIAIHLSLILFMVFVSKEIENLMLVFITSPKVKFYEVHIICFLNIYSISIYVEGVKLLGSCCFIFTFK